MEISLKLKREIKSNVQTLGTIYVYEGECSNWSCLCLELADLNNQSNISRIPEGKYNVNKRWSEKYKNHFIIEDVVGRKYILIHSGNTYKHTRGCILVGDELGDVNGDGISDVLNSRDTLKELFNMMPDTFIMIIEDEE
jgi:hypothetical protein